MFATTQRSTFVTVLAWIFIALAGMGAVMGVLQGITMRMFLRSGGLEQMMQAAPSGAGLPPVAAFLFEHFQGFLLAALLGNLVTLACSIGLLKRREWARRGFIGLMVVFILWQIVGLGVQVSLFSSIHAQVMAAQAPGALDIGPFFIVIGVFSALFALAFGALFGWIAWKLMSKPVAAEFGG